MDEEYIHNYLFIVIQSNLSIVNSQLTLSPLIGLCLLYLIYLSLPKKLS